MHPSYLLLGICLHSRQMAVTPSTPAPRLTFTASLVVAEVVVVATNCLPRNCLAKRAVSFRESLEHIFIIHFFSALPFHPHFSTHFSHTFSFRYIIFITSSLTAFRCIHYLSSRFLLLFYLITSLHYTHLRTHTHTHTHTTRQCIEVLPQLRCSFTPSHFPTVFVCLCSLSFYRKELLC